MPSKTVLKSLTPDSVKALMVIEAIVIAFFSFWLANEYYYNVYFRIYVDSVFIQHLTAYTIAIGLGIGLAGTAVAAALYKTMREAKIKLEAVAPRIKGSVEKLLANVPMGDAKTSLLPAGTAPARTSQTASTTLAPPILTDSSPASDEKK